MAKKNTATKQPERDPDLPEGFEEVARSRVAGWYIVEEGNCVRGIIRDMFEVPDQFQKRTGGKKRVYKIELTGGETKIVGEHGATETVGEGALIGVDEKGYLQKLADLKDREVFIKCKGKGEAKKGQSAPWVFIVAAVPF